ncbi:MAG: TAXI family TRAP transporter solute-binding subunit [Clostridiales bacterium]|nr:TAXI family TRAP transporter solute-binding subunit [Clostridiales bacterium]
MRRNRMKYSLLLVMCFFLIAGCVHEEEKSSHGNMDRQETDFLQVLTIGTADSGGTMYPVGKVIAEVIGASDSEIVVNVSASTGSAGNVRSLMDGSIDLGLVSGDVAYAAVNGVDEFEGEPCENLRALAALYPSLSNWLALRASGLEWVHDLRGGRLGVGPENSATELAARIVLNSLGIDQQNSQLSNCGLSSGTEEVENRTLDAMHGFAGIPISGFSELCDRLPCVLLKYTSSELVQIMQENPFYYADVIPAGTYEGQTADVPTFGVKCLLCVREDMDEELVYELTSILYKERGELGRRHASMEAMITEGFVYDELPIALHDGARRYYEERGLLPTD